ncbi:tumor necrosis factor receptor superfamily member 6B [Pseudophryne corroboree]|uniref:tumor necrosis factor receptor superfamily member 6B n=1 Tax=Pseudophryne corroboree TaxID=495146 RepID=UPI0030814B6A
MFLAGAMSVLALLLMTMRESICSAPTYHWSDHETGEIVKCQQCPPGTFVGKHCTSKSVTECRPCPDQHYTQYWNYLEKCRFCNVICEDREEIKHECNATHNRVCECKPGYQRGLHFCVKVRECDPLSDDRDCDRAVIDFIVNQNISHENLYRLEETVIAQNGIVSHKRIRSLLRYIRNLHPDDPLLPRLLDILKIAKLNSLERKLRKKFIEQESGQRSVFRQ